MSDELTFGNRRALDAWLPMQAPAGFADRVLDARAAAAARPARSRRRVLAATVGVAVAAAAAAVVVVTRPGPDRAPETPGRSAVGAPSPARIDAGVPEKARPLPALPPTAADMRVPAGDGGAIHDPRGRVSIELDFTGQCPSGGFVEVSPGAKIAPLPPVRGRDTATIDLDAGRWSYAVYCETTPSSPPIAEGEYLVVRDAGDRPLPPAATTTTIDADGRVHRIAYQRSIPSLRVRTPRTNDPRYRLRVTAGTEEQAYDAQGPIITVPAFTLRDGSYQLRAGDAPNSPVTTVILERDWTAPQVELHSPRVGEPWRGELFVEGTALPGWTPSVDGVDLPLQSDGTFLERLMIRPGAKALVIRFTNTARNVVIYYVRRPG